MRATFVASLIATCLLAANPAGAEAQAYRSAANQMTVRTTARVEMPEILLLRPVATAVASWEGSTYTEYQLRFTLGANTSWVLTAATLPQGVSLLAEDGHYRDGANVVADRGGPSNAREHIVRVRVSDTAPDTWEQQLRLELRSAREAR